MAEFTLQQLIHERRGERSYLDLARESGNRPGLSAWQQWGTGKPRVSLPDTDSIRGMALALGVSQTEVLLAAARSAGLAVTPHDPSELRIAGGGLLPLYAQEALFMTARSMALLATESN
jgi:hypothetical protein